MRTTLHALTILLLGLGSAAARADVDPTPAPQARSLCFSGGPASECRSFLLTEFGYLSRLARDSDRLTLQPTGNDRNFYFFGDVGWMKNLPGGRAVGATVYYGADDDGSRLALKPRLRQWLGERTSVDLSAGVIIHNFSGYYDRAPGFTGALSLNWRDWAALVTQVEVIPYEGVVHWGDDSRRTVSGSEVVWYGGLRIGSYPGAAALVLAPAALLVHFLFTYEA